MAAGCVRLSAAAALQALAIEHGYMQYSVNSTVFHGGVPLVLRHQRACICLHLFHKPLCLTLRWHAVMYSTVTGEVMDEVILTKPPGWTLNTTVKATQLSLFEPGQTLGDNWIDTFGEPSAVAKELQQLHRTPCVPLGKQA